MLGERIFGLDGERIAIDDEQRASRHSRRETGSVKNLGCPNQPWDARRFRCGGDGTMEWTIRLEARTGWGEVTTCEIGALRRGHGEGLRRCPNDHVCSQVDASTARSLTCPPRFRDSQVLYTRVVGPPLLPFTLQ